LNSHKIPAEIGGCPTRFKLYELRKGPLAVNLGAGVKLETLTLRFELIKARTQIAAWARWRVSGRRPVNTTYRAELSNEPATGTTPAWPRRIGSWSRTCRSRPLQVWSWRARRASTARWIGHNRLKPTAIARG